MRTTKEPLPSLDEEELASAFNPREYQLEIFEAALKNNTIALLGTGTGKTFIGIMLIKEMSHQLQKPFDQGGKRTIFLVPTLPLVDQQSRTIRDHTNLKVNHYYGSKGLDNWSRDTWHQEFVRNQVLVMTPEVFKIILHHGFLALTQVNLLIFDECHQAVKNHPYREIMKCFVHCPPQSHPRILGLTASLINGKCKLANLESQILSLERTLKSSVVTANDVISLKKYGTDPVEQILLYYDYDLRNYELLNKIDAFLSHAISITSPPKHPTTEEEDILNQKFFTSPRKCMNHIKTILTTLGPWCTFFASYVFEGEIGKLLFTHHYAALEGEDLDTLRYTLRILRSINSLFGKVFPKDQDEATNLLHLLPSKLSKLLEILRGFREGIINEDGTMDELCGIIFVQQRVTAYVLHCWLRRVSEFHPEFNFVCPNFIMGHGLLQTTFLKSASMNISSQKRILQDFRQKQFNLLVATSVIEEGMDVCKCNVVVRFDVPKDFRAYVQSKGRARAKKSFYILMVPTSEKDSFLSDAVNFKNIEELLSKKCHNRTVPSQEEIALSLVDNIIPPYMPEVKDGAPRITLNSAISLVNRYCSMLPCDRSSKLVPRWRIKEHTGAEASEGCSLALGYQCTIYLPINSPLKHPIMGPIMTTKQEAKMAAAFYTCIELHKIEELDDHFIPLGNSISRLDEGLLTMDPRDLVPEEVPPTAPQPGTRKRRQIYPKKFSEWLRPGAPVLGQTYQLYRLDMGAGTPQTLGLVVSQPLPPVPPIPIFSPQGKSCLFLHHLGDLAFESPQQLLRLVFFHYTVFREIVRNDLLHLDLSNAPYMALVVPLLEDQIDWPLTVLLSKSSHHPASHLRFQGAVVHRAYKTSRNYLFVSKVETGLTPLSPFPDPAFASYKDYYLRRYRIEVTNPHQPLLEVVPVGSVNMAVPPPPAYFIRKLRTAGKQHLVPELCEVHQLSGQLWRLMLALPTFLFRLNSLLLATRLKMDCMSPGVFAEADPQDSLVVQYIYPESCPRGQDASPHCRVYFDHHPPLDTLSGPSAILLLHALTTTSAGDVFNLDCLQTIGDSFLKFTTTLLLFTTFPDKDEGKLSVLRSRLIRNSYLYRLGRKRNIPQLMVTSMFEAQTNWLPPAYILASPRPTEFLCQEIPDKSVANSVEALIGAFLLSCGPLGALQLMTWLGIRVCQDQSRLAPSQVDQVPFTWVDKPPMELFAENDRVQEKLMQLYAGMETLEHSIGYHFRNKAYLVQAFTHASYIFNRITGCYQRLEFLGDAILDYIITCYILRTTPQQSPGALTDLRSSLVNNSFFAFLSIKYGFHRHIKLSSPGLFKDISDYVEMRKPNPEESDRAQIQQYLSRELRDHGCDVEVPKALGDVFESVAGAIYLDSEMSLDAVWGAYHPMMATALELFSQQIPIHPVRALVELFPHTHFTIQPSASQATVIVEVPSVGTFVGSGQNRTVAKCNAAKQALGAIKNR